MNTIIEEIRKRIEARKKNTYHAGDYDEYADGIVVGLSYALGIIDEVEKEHPVPAEEGKILPKLREFLATATPEELEAKYRELEYLLAPKDEDADKAAEMAARRAYPYDGGTKGYICEASIPIFCKGFKAGIAYERERLIKEAVECEIGWSDCYRIAPADEKSMNEALAKIGVLDQVGAGVDAKVSVIIIKKEK